MCSYLAIASVSLDTPLIIALISIYDSTLAVNGIIVKGAISRLLIKASVRESRKHAANMGYRYISKEDRPLKSLLMAPKDNDPINSKSGVIYRYQCNDQGCGEEYIGESGRTFAERFNEHQKPPSPIFDHCNTSGDKININKFTIVGREDQNLTRAIKEAILIRVNDPSLTGT